MSKKIVFIVCPGHSGSTLLGYILGSHSHATYVGEIRALRKRLNSKKRGVCGVCGDDCSFWYGTMNADGFLDRYARADHWWDRLPGRLFPERYAKDIYTRLFEVTGSDLLVDSSHFASWASVAARYPREAESIVVNMVRDGRAFVASHKRKGRDVEQMTRIWVKRVEDIETFLRTWPEERAIMVRYQDLASEPEVTIRGLTERLGLVFEPEMLDYWKHEHHNVGGNTGVRLSVADYAGKPLRGRHTRKDIDYYEVRKRQIFLDERWKHELTQEELEVFDRIGGDLNVRRGYPRFVRDSR